MSEDLINHQPPSTPHRDTDEAQLKPQRSGNSAPPFAIDTSSASRQWEEAVHAKQARLLIADRDERLTLFGELAELYSQRLEYRQASPKMPGSGTEFKAITVLAEIEQWKPRIELLSHLAGEEQDRIRRGNFYYTAGVIYREALNSTDQAVAQFNLALNSYFAEAGLIPRSEFNTYLKPFEAIKEIYIQQDDWKKLEVNYRKMIGRTQRVGADQVSLTLWRALGEIYRLHDTKSAIQTFEHLAQLEPGNAKCHEVLAELYIGGGPDFIDKATNEWMLLLEKNPYKIEAYKSLRKIYMDSHQYDKAWCLCSVLTYLQRADPGESQFFERYQTKNLTRARAQLTDELWNKYVYHRDEARLVSDILAVIYSAVGMMKSVEHKHFGLKRRQRLDLKSLTTPPGTKLADEVQAPDVPADLEMFLGAAPTGEPWRLGHKLKERPILGSEPSLFSKVCTYVLEVLIPGRKPKENPALAAGLSRVGNMFTYIMQVLNVPSNLEFYFRPDQADDLRVANCKERLQLIPSILIGSGMLAGRSDKELAFPISVFLTKMRPEYYLRQIIGSHSELSAAIQAAIQLVEPAFLQLSAMHTVVQQYRLTMLPFLPPAAIEHLKMVVPRFTQAKSKLDMAKWTQAVDLTSHRVGLLLANDLTLVTRFIGVEPQGAGCMDTKDKIKELLMYAISPKYFELRQLLGIAIQ